MRTACLHTYWLFVFFNVFFMRLTTWSHFSKKCDHLPRKRFGVFEHKPMMKSFFWLCAILGTITPQHFKNSCSSSEFFPILDFSCLIFPSFFSSTRKVAWKIMFKTTCIMLFPSFVFNSFAIEIKNPTPWRQKRCGRGVGTSIRILWELRKRIPLIRRRKGSDISQPLYLWNRHSFQRKVVNK